MPDATLKHDEEIEHKFWWDIECLKLKWRKARDEQQSSPERRDTINLLLSQIESNTPTAFDIERFDAWRKTLGSQGSTVFKLAAQELGELVLPVTRDTANHEPAHEPPWLTTKNMARALGSLNGIGEEKRLKQLRDANRKGWLAKSYRMTEPPARHEFRWNPIRTFEAFITQEAQDNSPKRETLTRQADNAFANNATLAQWKSAWKSW